MSIQALCKPCEPVHAAGRRATVHNIDTLLNGQVGGADFFQTWVAMIGRVNSG